MELNRVSQNEKSQDDINGDIQDPEKDNQLSLAGALRVKTKDLTFQVKTGKDQDLLSQIFK